MVLLWSWKKIKKYILWSCCVLVEMLSDGGIRSKIAYGLVWSWEKKSYGLVYGLGKKIYIKISYFLWWTWWTSMSSFP